MNKNYSLLTSTFAACFFLFTSAGAQTSASGQKTEPDIKSEQSNVSKTQIVPASSVRTAADLSASYGNKSLWQADSSNMPGKLKAFQENKGQFLNLVNNWTISYGANCQGTQILFTNKGLLYYIPHKVEMTEEEAEQWEKGKSEAQKKQEEQHEQHYKTVYEKVAVDWENANPNLTIEALDQAPYYFGSVNPETSETLKSIDNIHGFGKLIYHDVYPGIDVEFTFHPIRGIEYAVKVKPGYDASVFIMHYSGQKGLVLDEKGNIHMKTPTGAIIDHAPVANQDNVSVTAAFKKISKNEVAFEIGQYDKSKELVIDPWLVSPVALGYNPMDCGTDNANNVYVLEWSAGAMYIQKYTSAGALVWTYNCTQYGVQSSISDMAVDPTGNTYTPQPYYYINGGGGSYAMLSLNAAGVLRYFYNTYASSAIFETWGTGYSCVTGKVIESGSPTVTQEQVGIVNAANGNLLGALYSNATISELYAATIGQNGNLYTISSNLCFCTSGVGSLTNTLQAWNIAGVTAAPIWKTVIPNYNFADFSFKNVAGIPDNGVGTSCTSVYTSDGLNLFQFNINTGVKTAGPIAIPGGSNTLGIVNSGIAVDPVCGYIYVGSQTDIQVYNSALAPVTTYPTPGIVNDLSFYNGVLTAVGATSSSAVTFVAQFAGQTCPPPVITHTNTTCGNNNGTANIANPTFCVGPYTYLWTPSGKTTQNVTGLSAGTYSVTISSSGMCDVVMTDTVTIFNSASYTISTVQTNVKCNGGATGSATVTATGGVLPYTYAWTPVGGTNATASNLTAGTYTITVKDHTGCTVTATVTITQPPVLTATTTTVPVKCNGGNTGSATVTAGGGTPGYVYAWTPVGGTSTTASNLTAGTYTITVTDANGCMVTATAVITQPPVLTATTTVVNVKCNGAATGSATVTAGGGTPAYVYTWAPSGGTNATASNLTVGTYTVTVKDANGCTITATATITQPPVLTATTTVVNVKCNGGATGSATVTAGGGTPAYVYTWAPSGGTNPTASNLTIGTYTVTVKDVNGCTITATATITQPPVLTATTTVVNVKCNGGATGSATVTAGGGTPGYNYSWAPVGGTNTLASNLTAGTYTVTVTDANGCTVTATATITQPPVLTATTTVVNVKCNGGATGSATVTAGGGTPAYNYSWAPVGGTNALASNLTAGIYTVTVTDANGCTITATATITQPPVLMATTTTLPATCGNNNGSATVTPGGGTPGYVYAWTPVGGTNATASNLTAGTYTITVKDANGCTVTATAIVASTGGVTVTICATTNVKCNGGNTGSLTACPVGGTAPYTYAWTPVGGTNAIASNLTAGTYTITVKDANGCVATASATITQPPVLTATTTVIPVKCNGGATGSSTVTAGGGTPGYNYLWAPSGGSNATASNLTAGTYTVTVTDANGCTITATSIITQPTALTVTTAVIPVKCNGGNTGSATATAGGGTPGYNYSWAPVGGTNALASNLTVGTYTVTVTDANGCTQTATAIVTQPTALTATTTITPATCGNSDGTATVTPGGGTPAYIYSWAPSGGAAATASGLTAGVYTVTVTDANGCTITATANVTSAAAETVTICATTNVKCNGGNTGVLTACVVGGTPAYTYAWTPVGGAGATASGLTAGTYTITVKDANGCIATASATITQPPALTALTANTPVKCNGGNTGSVDVTTGGGTPGYNYSWAPGGQTSASVTALTAGIYTVTVTDANGCTITATATITQPTALTASTIVNSNVSCNGGNNGITTATGGGGTPGYTYIWAPGGQTNVTATGLTAGTYTVTITDANGCTQTATATIVQPTPLAATTTTVQSICGNANGSATVLASGGTPGYVYSWAPSGGSAATATGLSAGIYTVTVTDANGCTITATATVANASGETVTICTTTNVSCNGGSNGLFSCCVVGGTPLYTYAWTPAGGTGATASGLTAGTYTITVKDANGCIATASATLTQPTALTASTTTIPVLCNGGNTGSADVLAGGGVPPYGYAWAPGGQTNANATGLTAGTYTVTVTDANGCTITATATVTQPPLLTVTTGAIVNVSCNAGTNGSVGSTPTGGTPAYNYAWTPSGGSGANATGLSAGTYTITITDANGCTATAIATITQPTVLTATTTTVSSTCGNSNGSATAVPGGGTGPYGYSWAPTGGSSITAIGLSASIYTVTVTDAHGCTITATANVTNLPGETVTICANTPVSCNGGSNGALTSCVVGGTGPFTYAWTPAGGTNVTASNLTAGSYTVTVHDANGCIATASATITQPPLLTATASVTTNVTCNAGNNGSLGCAAGGGTLAYKYAWTPAGGTNATASNLTAGTYTITVTDANGCAATASTTITQPPVLTLAAAGFPVTCNGGSDGQVTAIPGGGTPGYIYAWTPVGGTNAIASNLSAGTYTITVTDAHGCSHDTSVIVSQPAPIVVTFNADSLSGCAPLCVNFKDLTTDPGGIVTKWNWSFGDGGTDTVKDPRHCYSNPGSYTVTLTVVDNHGCTSTLVINNMITVYSFPIAAFTLGPQPATMADPQITFSDKSTDAYGIGTWLWNFSDPMNDVPSNLENPTHTYGDTGTYCATLTVTNIHGCKDSVTECLVIGPNFTLYIPDAFSPNGDGPNQVFTAKGTFITSFKMYIFDRWGMQLYYTEDMNKGWPGTVNGGTRICQEDTYVYMIEAVDINQGKHNFIGKVTLLR